MDSQRDDSLPITEQENPSTANLSSSSISEIVALMNQEDALVAAAVRQVLPEVVKAVAGVVERLQRGGRLFYIGTGTSGRLGVLDASECPPTFGVPADLVVAVIAGGYEACYRAVEASEDDAAAGANDLVACGFSAKDALVGIAASGRTPYTIGAVEQARALSGFTVALTCVPDSRITQVAEVSIVPVVGPEVLTGSTRLKAGTAQKLVLNMISTATLVKLGYVSGNRMSNVQARNAKLRERAIRILMAEARIDRETAAERLSQSGNDLRVALVMSRTGRASEAARAALERSNWIVDQAIKLLS